MYQLSLLLNRHTSPYEEEEVLGDPLRSCRDYPTQLKVIFPTYYKQSFLSSSSHVGDILLPRALHWYSLPSNIYKFNCACEDPNFPNVKFLCM